MTTPSRFSQTLGRIGLPLSERMTSLADGKLWNWPAVGSDAGLWAASAFTLGSGPRISGPVEDHSIILRRLENEHLAPRWMALKRAAGNPPSDQGVGDFFVGVTPGDVGFETKDETLALRWRADAGAWLANAQKLLASGELEESEAGRLSDVFLDVQRRWQILTEAGIGLGNPTLEFFKALPGEIWKQIPSPGDWGLILVVAVVAGTVILNVLWPQPRPEPYRRRMAWN